jgi:hypothetical protein
MKMDVLEENFAEFLRDYISRNPGETITPRDKRLMRSAFMTGTDWGERGVIADPVKRAYAARQLASLQKS